MRSNESPGASFSARRRGMWSVPTVSSVPSATRAPRAAATSARRGGRAIDSEILGGPLRKARRDHEHLEPGVSIADETGDLGARARRWIGHDDVEREVRNRTRRVVDPALDAGSKRAILLVDHR